MKPQMLFKKTKQFPESDLNKIPASISDAKQIIDDDFTGLAQYGGWILYRKLQLDMSDLLKALKKFDYPGSVRANKLKSKQSSLVGHVPRNITKDNICRASANLRHHPQEHK